MSNQQANDFNETEHQPRAEALAIPTAYMEPHITPNSLAVPTIASHEVLGEEEYPAQQPTTPSSRSTVQRYLFSPSVDGQKPEWALPTPSGSPKSYTQAREYGKNLFHGYDGVYGQNAAQYEALLSPRSQPTRMLAYDDLAGTLVDGSACLAPRSGIDGGNYDTNDAAQYQAYQSYGQQDVGLVEADEQQSWHYPSDPHNPTQTKDDSQPIPGQAAASQKTQLTKASWFIPRLTAYTGQIDQYDQYGQYKAGVNSAQALSPVKTSPEVSHDFGHSPGIPQMTHRSMGDVEFAAAIKTAMTGSTGAPVHTVVVEHWFHPSDVTTIKPAIRKLRKKGAPDAGAFAGYTPLPNEHGMYFDDDIHVSQAPDGLQWPPRDDPSLPTDSSSRRQVVKELLAAMNDVSSMKDQIGDIIVRRWLPEDYLAREEEKGELADDDEWLAYKASAVDKFYKPWMKEKVCWEVATVLEKLYREGTHFVNILDPGLLEEATKTREQTFLERKEKLIDLLTHFKSRCDKLLRGTCTHEYVLVINKIVKESNANKINNDRRQKDLTAGRNRPDREVKKSATRKKKEPVSRKKKQPAVSVEDTAVTPHHRTGAFAPATSVDRIHPHYAYDSSGQYQDGFGGEYVFSAPSQSNKHQWNEDGENMEEITGLVHKRVRVNQ